VTECNGAGACETGNGAACSQASQCQSGFCVDGVCCNTACSGLCQACSNAKTGSANGTCANITINTDPDNECSGGASCSGGACTQGATCMTGSGCASGFCVDGFCCNSACSGLCQACSNAKTGGANGTCANVTVNTDPDNECSGAALCNAGKCTQGALCMQNADCGSGFCVDGVCCNSACGGLCQACSAAKTGGADGTCGNVTANIDPDNECTTECNGAGACEATNGAACVQASQCQSGFCVDGFCCDMACNGLCQSCSGSSTTGGINGMCDYIKASTDPDNECAGAQNCNGAGVCQ
jgi:hypothetical protein